VTCWLAVKRYRRTIFYIATKQSPDLRHSRFAGAAGEHEDATLVEAQSQRTSVTVDVVAVCHEHGFADRKSAVAVACSDGSSTDVADRTSDRRESGPHATDDGQAGSKKNGRQIFCCHQVDDDVVDCTKHAVESLRVYRLCIYIVYRDMPVTTVSKFWQVPANSRLIYSQVLMSVLAYWPIERNRRPVVFISPSIFRNSFSREFY
jgi:hypothetical protein